MTAFLINGEGGKLLLINTPVFLEAEKHSKQYYLCRFLEAQLSFLPALKVLCSCHGLEALKTPGQHAGHTYNYQEALSVKAQNLKAQASGGHAHGPECSARSASLNPNTPDDLQRPS
jgi:hypothetical protein